MTSKIHIQMSFDAAALATALAPLLAKQLSDHPTFTRQLNQAERRLSLTQAARLVRVRTELVAAATRLSPGHPGHLLSERSTSTRGNRVRYSIKSADVSAWRATDGPAKVAEHLDALRGIHRER